MERNSFVYDMAGHYGTLWDSQRFCVLLVRQCLKGLGELSLEKRNHALLFFDFLFVLNCCFHFKRSFELLW